ncbi:MAG: site-specific DNA-methyltransferase [bacterium]
MDQSSAILSESATQARTQRRTRASTAVDPSTITIPENVARWPIERLRPYQKNSRTHTRAQITKIAASITEFGFTNPILIAADGEIIAGHARLAAAQQLGMSEVPVLVLGHLSEKQRRALVIADNRLALDAGWDFDMLSEELAALKDENFNLDVIGFDADELRDLLGEDEPEEEIPPLPEHPVTRPGDTWHLGNHVLVCGDSTDEQVVARAIGDKRAALFATDPPYLVDYDGTNHPSKRPKANKDWDDQYADWDNAEQGQKLYDDFIAVAIKHAILPNAAWYCWHASRRQAMLEDSWTKAGAIVHQQIVWVKTRGVLTRSTYLWRHEVCLHGWLQGNRPPFRRQREDPTTIWEVASSEVESKDHPTSKPTKLFETPMLVHTQVGDTCYEPFSGSGSQIIAAERTKRRCVAIELNPRFVDVAVLRWQNLTGKHATLDSGERFDAMKAAREETSDATA